MRCEECLPLVEDYFDGEVEKEMADLIAQHIAACAGCASAHEQLEREQGFYLRYECDAQVAPSFWNSVMALVTRENDKPATLSSRLRWWLGNTLGAFSAPRFSPSLTALIALAAIGITAGVMLYLNSRERFFDAARASQHTGTPASIPSPAPGEIAAQHRSIITDAADAKGSGTSVGERQPALNSVERKDDSTPAINRRRIARLSLKPELAARQPTPEQLIREAEQRYLAAIAMLSRDVSRQRSRLNAATATRFAQTLAAIDRTITDTRRAVREHPGDPVAAQYMMTAYAKKVDVLREMVGY